jgi:ATP-dependent Lon protease
VKKFYGKLSLIDEPATKEKVRKEVDRFAAMDKQSSEHSKLHQYLDEIFSLPWRTHTVPPRE